MANVKNYSFYRTIFLTKFKNPSSQLWLHSSWVMSPVCWHFYSSSYSGGTFFISQMVLRLYFTITSFCYNFAENSTLVITVPAFSDPNYNCDNSLILFSVLGPGLQRRLVGEVPAATAESSKQKNIQVQKDKKRCE